MIEDTTTETPNPLARAFEGILILAMVLSAVSILATILGHNGLGLVGGDLADNRVMSIESQLNFPVDFGDPLPWAETDNGTVDAATGLAPVELTGPVFAQVSLWGPTTAERLIWILWKISGPMVVIAGAWLVYQMTRSTRKGDPFSPENEKRLWQLAAVVAFGGAASMWFGEFAQAWLVQRSAAASLVDFSVNLRFMPLIIGLGVAMLASIWRVGVGMRDDVEGMV